MTNNESHQSNETVEPKDVYGSLIFGWTNFLNAVANAWFDASSDEGDDICAKATLYGYRTFTSGLGLESRGHFLNYLLCQLQHFSDEETKLSTREGERRIELEPPVRTVDFITGDPDVGIYFPCSLNNSSDIDRKWRLTRVMGDGKIAFRYFDKWENGEAARQDAASPIALEKVHCLRL